MVILSLGASSSPAFDPGEGGSEVVVQEAVVQQQPSTEGATTVEITSTPLVGESNFSGNAVRSGNGGEDENDDEGEDPPVPLVIGSGQPADTTGMDDNDVVLVDESGQEVLVTTADEPVAQAWPYANSYSEDSGEISLDFTRPDLGEETSVTVGTDLPDTPLVDHTYIVPNSEDINAEPLFTWTASAEDTAFPSALWAASNSTLTYDAEHERLVAEQGNNNWAGNDRVFYDPTTGDEIGSEVEITIDDDLNTRRPRTNATYIVRGEDGTEPLFTWTAAAEDTTFPQFLIDYTAAETIEIADNGSITLSGNYYSGG